MDERSISSNTRAELSAMGYVVIKHEESFSVGIPDMSVTGDGRTLWVEDKYLEVAAIKHSIGARSLVDKKRVPQMNMMRRLEVNGLAQYWLYQNVNGTTYVGWLNPASVFESYQTKTSVAINNVMPKSEWIKTFKIMRFYF